MRGIIYCIKQKETDFDSPIYIGSTKDFSNRKITHYNMCNNLNGKDYNLKVYKYIRSNGGRDNFEMIEIGIVECENNEELKIEEQKWIEDLGSDLNDRRAYTSPEEKKKQHRQRSKIYSEKHKKKLNKSFVCPCGVPYTLRNKARHIKTKKHQTYVGHLNKDLN